MTLDEPVPFVEALKHLVGKEILPTDFNTAQMRAIDANIRRNSFWSAQNTIEAILQAQKGAVLSILEPTIETREDRVTESNPSVSVTTGFNPATARTRIKELFDEIGYKPAEGTEGGLLDLSSDKRIDLVIKTQTQLAHGAGRYVQENADPDVVDLWPALEFVRFEDRKEPRDWEHRWRIAAQVAGDVDAARVLEETGRMVALKDSDIWQQLGDGAGGYDDTLGNPYPPFAFGSGMWTEEVSRAEAEDLGLLDNGEKAEGAVFDLGSLFAIGNDGTTEGAIKGWETRRNEAAALSDKAKRISNETHDAVMRGEFSPIRSEDTAKAHHAAANAWHAARRERITSGHGKMGDAVDKHFRGRENFHRELAHSNEKERDRLNEYWGKLEKKYDDKGLL